MARRIFLVLSLLSVLILAALLYAPYLGSPPVFDDHNLIENLSVFDHAQRVFSSTSRTFPYFSIGFVHVVSGGDLAWNRVVNIALHCLVILALYFFLARATRRLSAENPSSQAPILLFVCLWVALNPAAVYGVGYLVQRTILLATLFGIVSSCLYLRAQQEARNADLVSSALLAGLSMMSKEHAILIPVATLMLTPLVVAGTRAGFVRAIAYLGLTLPAMIWVLLNRGADIIGNRYEIYAGEVLSQVSVGGVHDFPGGAWAMSAATQILLFWKYLVFWLLPNPAWMSADMRIDFAQLWTGTLAWGGLVASLLLVAGALWAWLRPRQAGAGGQRWAAVLLFAAIPFAVELSAVKVQEPFVLYRSYLWMPAYALLLCLLLFFVDARLPAVWPRRLLWSGLAVAGLALFPLAQDRLASFSSEEALWQDAARKLPRADVAGADRIYYNLAGEAFRRKDYESALELSERVVEQNPSAFQGYLARGTSLLALKRPQAALQAFDDAEAHHPAPGFLGYIEFKRCSVYEALGQRAAVIACLRRSAALGYEMARFQLKMAGLAE